MWHKAFTVILVPYTLSPDGIPYFVPHMDCWSMTIDMS